MFVKRKGERCIAVPQQGKMGMSVDKDQGLADLMALVQHVGRIGFSGTITASFCKGVVTSVSRKEEFDPKGLNNFINRPIMLKKAKVDKVKEDTVIEPNAKSIQV